MKAVWLDGGYVGAAHSGRPLSARQGRLDMSFISQMVKYRKYAGLGMFIRCVLARN
ncbi:hypothetical protein [Fibrella arboris]|uniref:hypothetical protein n=1 Tax=Fibrella arboris TaxID=3242486 RepID=UPI0035219D36